MTYGPDFARIYNEQWASFTGLVWPAVARLAGPGRRGEQSRAWLDLCCGSGRLIARAARAGFSVTGMDRSPSQLAFARRNAPRSRLIRGALERLAVPGSFDVITCLYDSMNYVLTPTALAEVFRLVRRRLSPGGIFIFDVNTLRSHMTGWKQTTVTRGRRYLLVAEGSCDPDRRIARLRLTGFVRERNRYRQFEEVHVQKSYPAPEIAHLLRRAGFRFQRFMIRHGRRTAVGPGARRVWYACRGAP